MTCNTCLHLDIVTIAFHPERMIRICVTLGEILVEPTRRELSIPNWDDLKQSQLSQIWDYLNGLEFETVSISLKLRLYQPLWRQQTVHKNSLESVCVTLHFVTCKVNCDYKYHIIHNQLSVTNMRSILRSRCCYRTTKNNNYCSFNSLCSFSEDVGISRGKAISNPSQNLRHGEFVFWTALKFLRRIETDFHFEHPWIKYNDWKNRIDANEAWEIFNLPNCTTKIFDYVDRKFRVTVHVKQQYHQ